MIDLPADALEVLEKMAGAKDDFTVLFKGLCIGGSGSVQLANPDTMIPVHSSLLLHIIANLVEAQVKIMQLEGRLAILKVDYATTHNTGRAN